MIQSSLVGSLFPEVLPSVRTGRIALGRAFRLWLNINSGLAAGGKIQEANKEWARVTEFTAVSEV